MLIRNLLGDLCHCEKHAIYFAVYPFILYAYSFVTCRQQDEELDELSASVERIGGVGLTIHEELLAQVGVVYSTLKWQNQLLQLEHDMEDNSGGSSFKN